LIDGGTTAVAAARYPDVVEALRARGCEVEVVG
jgi:hypothetical protein